MKIYSDGYTLGRNPSETGGGFVVMDELGNLLIHQEIFKTHFTNNEAELLGVLAAARIAREFDTIITDSMNTYWWVTKQKTKARPDLLPHAKEAATHILTKHVELIQEGRETNLAGIYIEDVLQH